MTWQSTRASTDPACTVTAGPNEIWIDEAPPYRYYAVLHDWPSDTPSPCSAGTSTELGGTFEPLSTLVFVPPDALRASALLFNMPPDPARVFRDAIRLGHAHDEGTTELDGRTVRRIRIDPSGYVYVDPDTFHPVEISGPAFGASASPLHVVTRYRTFEYLSRTAANLTLTDIRARHPNASGP